MVSTPSRSKMGRASHQFKLRTMMPFPMTGRGSGSRPAQMQAE